MADREKDPAWDKLSETEKVRAYAKAIMNEIDSMPTNFLTRAAKPFVKGRITAFVDGYDQRFGYAPSKKDDGSTMYSKLHQLVVDNKLPPPDKVRPILEGKREQMLKEVLKNMRKLSGSPEDLFPKDLFREIFENSPFFQPESPVSEAEHKVSAQPKSLTHCPLPLEMIAALDKTIIGQDGAKQVLANAFFYHASAVQQAIKGAEIPDYRKGGVLCIGSTGVGKTSLVSALAKVVGLPFLAVDATQFTPTGIYGKDATDAVRELYKQSKDHSLVPYGVIFIDEADKLVKGTEGVGGWFSKETQGTFLRMLENCLIDALPDHNPLTTMFGNQRKISTKYILFVLGGAFEGIEDIVEKRLGEQTVGFKRETNDVASARKYGLLTKVSSQDLTEYGFLHQLVGRLPYIAPFHDLTENDILRIMTESDISLLKQQQNLIRSATGVSVEFDDDALRAMAKKAHSLGLGARSIMTVTEDVLCHLRTGLPGLTGVNNVRISPSFVQEPKAESDCFFIQHYFRGFARKYLTKEDIALRINVKGIEFDALRPQAFISALESATATLPYALKLIKQDTFTVTKDFLNNPDAYLNSYVKRKLKQKAGNKNE
ncbi:AAA family ATPase [Candidatus Woesearchaeota archaeon]|nr:AAA family ATPase [Candidatus Woesearchaeota archaeon]